MFQKGDILKATHRKINEGKHFIIFLEGNSENDFIGGMITHSELYGNSQMSINHFEKNDENGKSYTVVYDNTYLVMARLIKPGIWGLYTKVGRLTDKGKKFVNIKIELLEDETFENFLNRTATQSLRL